MKIYLSRPPGEYESIKQKLELSLDAEFVDPATYRVKTDDLTEHECYDLIEREVDSINSSDMALVVPGAYEGPFVVMLAHSIGKKAFIITEQLRGCPWLRMYSDCIFHSWDAFECYMLSCAIRH